MPELAEVRLTADYINKAVKGLVFSNIEKNPVHKGDSFEVPTAYTITAESRGKELLLKLRDADTHIPIRFNLGMSGYFEHKNLDKSHKHAHLKFIARDGTSLNFVDVRRFGRWNVGLEWSSKRGPDPTLDYPGFVQNILDNIHKPAFKKPIYELLMDQKWFNGIGNYLRAEIMYRVDVSPFIPAWQAIDQEPKILELCRDLPLQAYELGGGSIKDWKNPFGKEIKNWEEFMLCYGNETMSKVKDKTGRTFWHDPIWKQLDLNRDWDHYSDLPNPTAYIN